MRIHIRSFLCLLLAAILLFACNAQTSTINEARLTPRPNIQPTQDVGEEPPTSHSTDIPVSTQNFYIATSPPIPTATSSSFIGPGSYPTPGNQITPWDHLIDRKLLEPFSWETYRGTFQGADKSSYWTYSFNYPAEFYPSPQQSLNQGYVQNSTSNQAQSIKGSFIKFEAVALKDPPMINDGEEIAINDFLTVSIAGQTGVMRVNTQVPDQVRVISVVFSNDGGWVIATGYINLPTTDPTSMETWTMVILEILSTFEI